MCKKRGRLYQIIKFIVTGWFAVLRFTFTLGLRVLRLLFKGVSKRLRFSITFKAVSVYTIVFSAILFILSLIVVLSFGAFYFNQERITLEQNSKVTLNILKDRPIDAENQLKEYAQTVDITISLFNSAQELTYTTAEYIEGLEEKTTDRSGVFLSSDEQMNLKLPTGLNDDQYYLLISKSISVGKVYLFGLVAVTMVIFFLSILLTIIIGSRTLKKMLKPIDNMINTARSVSAQDLHTRLNVVDSHDELKELAETFNEMLNRIQASYEQQNQFVSDASHELRTPISVIQGYANLLQRWGKEDKEVLAEAVVAIRNEAENMKDLVEKLLFLARADKDTQKVEKILFSVPELMDEVYKETKLIDADHQILCTNSQEALSIIADRSLIKQALRVLIDNSIKHTPSGGTITISSTLQDRRVRLSIEDNGIGIANEDLPYIFNRFYKCDKSRTREAGGTGLGLSIAKWIVDKHRGYITAESVLNQGTKMHIYLPRE